MSARLRHSTLSSHTPEVRTQWCSGHGPAPRVARSQNNSNVHTDNLDPHILITNAVCSIKLRLVLLCKCWCQSIQHCTSISPPPPSISVRVPATAAGRASACNPLSHVISSTETGPLAGNLCWAGLGPPTVSVHSLSSPQSCIIAVIVTRG